MEGDLSNDTISVRIVSHDKMISEKRNEKCAEGDNPKPNCGLYWKFLVETEEEIQANERFQDICLDQGISKSDE
jgi:deoxyribodipyrimidine photolyase-like uncharacterized protein